jgi:hypothetical protein
LRRAPQLAYLVGHAVNEAYVSKNIAAVMLICVAIILVAAVKGLTTYFHTITLARISNRITATGMTTEIRGVIKVLSVMVRTKY